jgi:hypothetical protein
MEHQKLWDVSIAFTKQREELASMKYALEEAQKPTEIHAATPKTS